MCGSCEYDEGGKSPEILIIIHNISLHKYAKLSIILSQSSELVGVFSVQLSRLLLFKIASNFLRRKHGHCCLKVHSYLESSLLPVCILSDFVTSLLF